MGVDDGRSPSTPCGEGRLVWGHVQVLGLGWAVWVVREVGKGLPRLMVLRDSAGVGLGVVCVLWLECRLQFE